jgi:hypothetical protein
LKIQYVGEDQNRGVNDADSNNGNENVPHKSKERIYYESRGLSV